MVLAARNRKTNGKLQSLADIGYNDAGIGDGWQKCGGAYGPPEQAPLSQRRWRSCTDPDPVMH
jgi:hypothetical protein